MTSRIVGGPDDVSCLRGTQSDGIDEGWADYFSNSYTDDPVQSAYITGNNERGIRRQSYEGYTFTYEDLGNQGFQVHRDGEIWAATLWDLRGELGQETTDQLVMDGLKLTPCNPSMIDVRDGILTAQEATKGAGIRATVWEVFARHGMGFSASGFDGTFLERTVYNAAFDLPPDLQPGNRNPTITSQPRLVPGLDDLYVYAAEATDPDGDALAYELTEGPAGMTVDTTTGRIEWTASFTPQRVKVTVTDGNGGRVIHGFRIPVLTRLEPGQAVTIAGPEGSLGLAEFGVPPGTPVLQVKLRGGDGDADFSLFGPGVFALAVEPGTTKTFSISEPIPTLWAIFVTADETYAGVSLEASFPIPTLIDANTTLMDLSGEETSETFYRVVVPPGTTSFTVSTSGGEGDLDLYLNRNQVAVCSGFGALFFGLCEFDDLSLALDNDEMIEIVDPEPGDWFIDLLGFDAYSGVTLTTTTLVDGEPVPPGGVPGTPSGPSFVIETAAGSDPIRDGGQATSGVLYFPDSVALDGVGNLYISDTTHFRVRKVSADGVISTFAGTGISGFSGDGGPATAAQLASPRSLAVDSAGNVYIADIGNHNVRRVSADGVITTFAGLPPFRGFRGDGGPATNALLFTPIDVAVDGADNVYIADLNNDRIRMVDAQGLITTIAGTGVRGFSGDGGPATEAQLGTPDGIAIDGAGNLSIAGNSNHRVRVVNSEGIIRTLAGNGVAAFAGDGGPATSASLRFPRRLTLDADENLYIADAGNHRVRKVNPEGVITTVAGDGVSDFGGDGGPATAAQLSSLTDVAVDGTGEFYIADTANHRVRKVTPEGVISTAVGTSHLAGDGGPATQALLFSPFNMEPDGAGNIYIADTRNNVVRKATSDGIIRTVAGTGVFGFSGTVDQHNRHALRGQWAWCLTARETST